MIPPNDLCVLIVPGYICDRCLWFQWNHCVFSIQIKLYITILSVLIHVICSEMCAHVFILYLIMFWMEYMVAFVFILFLFIFSMLSPKARQLQYCNISYKRNLNMDMDLKFPIHFQFAIFCKRCKNWKKSDKSLLKCNI